MQRPLQWHVYGKYYWTTNLNINLGKATYNKSLWGQNCNYQVSILKVFAISFLPAQRIQFLKNDKIWPFKVSIPFFLLIYSNLNYNVLVGQWFPIHEIKPHSWCITFRKHLSKLHSLVCCFSWFKINVLITIFIICFWKASD